MIISPSMILRLISIENDVTFCLAFLSFHCRFRHPPYDLGVLMTIAWSLKIVTPLKVESHFSTVL